MSKIHTFKAEAVPVRREDDVTCWEPFGRSTKHRAELFADTPPALLAALKAWALSLPAPDGTYDGRPNTGYNVFVSVERCTRWPAGFKATFERATRYVARNEVAATA